MKGQVGTYRGQALREFGCRYDFASAPSPPWTINENLAYRLMRQDILVETLGASLSRTRCSRKVSRQAHPRHTLLALHCMEIPYVRSAEAFARYINATATDPEKIKKGKVWDYSLKAEVEVDGIYINGKGRDGQYGAFGSINPAASAPSDLSF